MTTILKSKNHGVATPKIQGFIDSFSSDLVHGISRGKVMTRKHYLLGLGLHNITGQKKVVQIVNRLGHSISYDEVLDIETAQAKRAREIIERGESSILPIIPKSDENQVSTVFWVENFDKKLDTERGGGTINITTMVTFQETSEGSVKTENFKQPSFRTKSELDTPSPLNLLPPSILLPFLPFLFLPFPSSLPSPPPLPWPDPGLRPNKTALRWVRAEGPDRSPTHGDVQGVSARWDTPSPGGRRRRAGSGRGAADGG